MLTQAEIDALLSGAIEIEQSDEQETVNLAELMGAKGEAEEPEEKHQDDMGREVRPYNFWSPDRFSKDHMRAIELIHEELGERLTNTMPTFLRTNIRPRIVHTEQGRFHDFLSDLNPQTLFHLINLAPLPGQFLVTISTEISYSILEIRLGGRSEKKNKNHTITDLDQSLLDDLIENMLNDIKASWSKIANVEPKLVDSTTNQHWVQMMIGNERVMMITFELAINDVTGTMSYYIPYAMLKPIINELNPHIIISGRKEEFQDMNARNQNYKNLAKINLPIKVLLGYANLTLKDLMELQKGDVLVLDTNAKQELVVDIADKPSFYGNIGKSGKRVAIKITGAKLPE
ncbi:MAG: FliM/FliN family flagellar motor switch protein [Anaerolineaceae bacterium]|nr:FliM/FliN family flagellar motor switch protein [Anaerolineaceae bacterium]